MRRWRSTYGKVAVVAALTLAAGVYASVRWAPFPEEKLARKPSSAVLVDRTGVPLRVRLATGDLDARPGYVPEAGRWIDLAIVAAEDQRFWQHAGVDVRALTRAFFQNLIAGRRVSGASTLSMQVIRLMEPRPRTLSAKIIEAFRALQLERRHSKTEILAQYLDRAPFGGNVVGIEAAAQRYFAKSATQLSLAEAALLAGLPQSPSRLRPDRHFDRAKKRQAYVLQRMVACGFITAEEHTAACAQALAVRPAIRYPFRAPHFCDWVGVPDRLGADATVLTTLDPALQQIAEDVLARHARNITADSGAIVILDAKTSAVRALAGSPDFRARPAGQVNGALAARAAGSTLKPFAFALAFDRGLVTPGTILTDKPRQFRDYVPQNFSREFRGRVGVRDALVQSLNLPAIEIEQRVGQERFYALLKKLGLGTISRPPEHYGLGLVLGNAEVRLLDLANAYACLARGGDWLPVRVIETAPSAAPKPLLSEEACWLISTILAGDERSMDTTGHAADVRLPPMAWKTGTSAGLRDAWTVAWNPDVVIGVWVGNANGAGADDLVGRQVATPMAWDVFRKIYPNNLGPWYTQPAGIETRAICADSGCAAGANCPHRISDWAIARVTRQTPCPLHTQQLAPAAIAAAEPAPDAHAGKNAGLVKILSPARDSAYRRLNGLEMDAQQLALTATSDEPGERLHWFVNDRPVGHSRPGQPLFWPLARGKHQIVCSSARGASDHIQIAVE